jgi:patatin-like phospholipase/acyl hydrolase
MIKILSIDGGGVRGIIPALILAEIEAMTGKPIARLFDLIAGSSTGGNLALGFVKPDANGNPQDSAAAGAILYEKNCPRIFSRTLSQKFNPVDILFEEKFSSAGLHEIMEGYYGETRLDQAITPVLITAYEIEKRTAYFFRSESAKGDDKNNFFMKDVVYSTTAAPTFFEPARVQDIARSDFYSFVDGGVFANNPALCAYAEARKMFPSEEDFMIVSLGTGELTQPILYHQAKGWGVAQWARPVFSVVLDGISSAVDQQLWQLLPTGNTMANRYYRFQPTLTPESSSFDNTSPENIETLKNLSKDLITNNQEALSLLCQQLKQDTD